MQKTIFIEGMHCAHCVSAVQEALLALEEVTAAEVDLAGKKAVVETTAADNSILQEAIEDIGFDVVEIR